MVLYTSQRCWRVGAVRSAFSLHCAGQWRSALWALPAYRQNIPEGVCERALFFLRTVLFTAAGCGAGLSLLFLMFPIFRFRLFVCCFFRGRAADDAIFFIFCPAGFIRSRRRCGKSGGERAKNPKTELKWCRPHGGEEKTGGRKGSEEGPVLWCGSGANAVDRHSQVAWGDCLVSTGSPQASGEPEAVRDYGK